MGDIVELFPNQTYQVTVASGGEYKIFTNLLSVTKPTLVFQEYKVLAPNNSIGYIAGSHTWEPIEITGDISELRELIVNSSSVRVTIEAQPDAKYWWELENAFASVESTETKLILVYRYARQHIYGEEPHSSADKKT